PACAGWWDWPWRQYGARAGGCRRGDRWHHGPVPSRPRARRLLAAAAVVAVAAGVAAGCASPSNWTPGQRAVVDAGTVLDPWFEAVRRADEEAATIVVMGDSVSE